MPKMPPAVASEKRPPRPHGDRPTHEEPLAALAAERMGILEFHHQRTALPHTRPERSTDKRWIHFGHNKHTEGLAALHLRSDARSLHPPPQTRSSVKQAGLVRSRALFPAAPWFPRTAKRLEFESEFLGTRPACIRELRNLG